MQDDLLKQLEQNGWTVIRQAGEGDSRAWFHEIWAVESRWSPHGFTLFLTFLTDPQPGEPQSLPGYRHFRQASPEQR